MSEQLSLFPVVVGRKPVKRNALTPVETEIMRRIVTGLGHKEIMVDLSLTKGSVDQSIHQMRKRFGARNTTHLAVMLVKRGLLK